MRNYLVMLSLENSSDIITGEIEAENMSKAVEYAEDVAAMLGRIPTGVSVVRTPAENQACTCDLCMARRKRGH